MEGLRYEEPGITVIEKPPICRTIGVKEFNREKERWLYNTYFLSFPWQVFCIKYNKSRCISLSLAFRNSPMTQEDQHLYYPNLWNIYPSLRVCMANEVFRNEQSRNITEEFYYNDVLGDFWNSMWTLSYTLHGPYKCKYAPDKRITNDGHPDWKTWQENTRKDPKFITTVPWTHFGNLDHLLTLVKDH